MNFDLLLALLLTANQSTTMRSTRITKKVVEQYLHMELCLQFFNHNFCLCIIKYRSNNDHFIFYYMKLYIVHYFMAFKCNSIAFIPKLKTVNFPDFSIHVCTCMYASNSVRHIDLVVSDTLVLNIPITSIRFRGKISKNLLRISRESKISCLFLSSLLWRCRVKRPTGI